MVQELQKEFGVEIATTIRTMKKYDFDQDKPKREISNNTDKALKEQEDADNMVFFERKVDEFIKRENQYKRDLPKVYSIIYTDYCTEGMQRRIKEKVQQNQKILNDPLELMRVIETAVHQPARAVYAYSALIHSLKQGLNLKQQENERLTEYHERFKQQQKYNEDSSWREFSGCLCRKHKRI
jgi:hypothetical protein